MKNHLFYISVIICFLSCKKKDIASFYFWKTTYNISSFEENYLDSLQIQKLYIRFFDVDLTNGKPSPVGEISIGKKNTKREIIPVVFITNETFKRLDKNAIERLAANVQKLIQLIHSEITDNNIKEIQFDCDWTASTRNNYFYFLNVIKKQNPVIFISATIRLHQIKDKEQTGIPPIDKGVLMYYATSNPLEFTDKNSILDNKLAKNYIKNINEYPLPLDVALPIYSWAIVQNQLGEKRLINGIRNQDLKDTSLYQPLKPNFYKIKKDHYLKGNYLYEDFILKTEEISSQDLINAKHSYSSKLKNSSVNTIFFQLDSSNLSHYSVQDFKTILK